MRAERSSGSILIKRFLSPRRGSNPQPSDDWLDALTIDLLRLRWLERLTGHQKVVGSTPVWGSEIVP